MAIAARASGTSNFDVTASPQTLSVPAGVVNNDLMVVVVSYDGGRTITAPGGWTNLFLNVGNGTMKASIWYRLASSEPASYSWTRSGTPSGWGATLVTFSGVDTATQIDASGTSSTNTGASPLTANAVTVATDQAWHLIAFGTWNSGTITATSFTVSQNGATPNQQAALLYNTTPKSIGSTGTVSVACAGSTAGQVLSAMPFAIRPAAGGQDTPELYGRPYGRLGQNQMHQLLAQ